MRGTVNKSKDSVAAERESREGNAIKFRLETSSRYQIT